MQDRHPYPPQAVERKRAQYAYPGLGFGLVPCTNLNPPITHHVQV